MPTNVIMPQMGESIAEGTIVRWLKAVGEPVVKDEPLIEISTDKVDAEVPAPASGILTEILHGPNTTVAVETVIGVIAAAGEAAAPATTPALGTPASVSAPASAVTPPPGAESAPAPAVAEPQNAKVAPAPVIQQPPVAQAVAVPVQPPVASLPAVLPDTAVEAPGDEAEAVRRRSSPLVRQIAREHGLDIAAITGSGIHGRVTKDDILAFIAAQQAAPAPAQPASPTPAAPPMPRPAPAPVVSTAPAIAFTADEQREPLSIMRQKIAEHMVASRHTSPHVHTVFEVDMSRIVALRDNSRAAFESQHGIKLTVTPFFLAAVIEGLKAFPAVNASIDGHDIVYHRHINLGVAVAMPNGLIVPVIKRAEELSLIGLQRALADLATRARSKQLKPDDVQGSTFSLTNPGPYGGLYGLPIINQPNVAIMSTGGIHKRPVVITDEQGRDAIGIRDMVYLALSFDHRLVDGAMADQFMAHVKRVLEAGAFELA